MTLEPAASTAFRGRAALRALAALLTLLLPSAPRAATAILDDAGNRVVIEGPARRIVSLAPHATELLFAAGAGDRIVATVDYSDYPAEARAIPRLGGYEALDVERLLAAKPDLVVAWESGNGPAAIARLRALGLRLYLSEPRDLEGIAAGLERLGRLAGTEATANRAAERFRERLAELRRRQEGKRPVTLFYEVWNHPLTTVGGGHFISRVIGLCGGRNIFAELGALAPAVSLESVVAADPEAIVASGMDEERPAWLDEWRRWPRLRAVREGHLFSIPPDLLQRPTPRLLDGAERLCADLDRARAGR